MSIADEWIRKLWYIYTMEYYSAFKKNAFESVLMRWMKPETIIHSNISQKEKHQYSILMHISTHLWTPYLGQKRQEYTMEKRQSL